MLCRPSCKTFFDFFMAFATERINHVSALRIPANFLNRTGIKNTLKNIQTVCVLKNRVTVIEYDNLVIIIVKELIHCGRTRLTLHDNIVFVLCAVSSQYLIDIVRLTNTALASNKQAITQSTSNHEDILIKLSKYRKRVCNKLVVKFSLILLNSRIFFYLFRNFTSDFNIFIVKRRYTEFFWRFCLVRISSIFSSELCLITDY